MNSYMSKRMALSVTAAAVMLGALGGCLPLVVGGALVGSLVVTDRRTSGSQLEDEGIELRGAARIRSTVGERGHINLTSYNRQVLLTGEVPTAQDKLLVEQTIARVENVVSVVNELAVLGNSTLGQRSSDVLVTGRIRAQFIDAADLTANAFKVVTERGTTYLMGRVTQREADRATNVVRATPGVQKVVRIFEVISESELARLQPAPVKAPPSGSIPTTN